MKRQVSPLVQEILSYLLDHPNAEDTIEGITEWWVLEECLQRRTAEVQQALDELVAMGWVTRKPARYSGVRYRLADSKLAELRKLAPEEE